MSHEVWRTGIEAKVTGTWNLHHALNGKDGHLDFFIMTSSISGKVATATEGNYCAANNFLDTFARYRQSLGLPAVAIGLGMISEVGYLHEHPTIEDLLLRKGIRPITEDEMLQIFDLVLFGATASAHANDQFSRTHLLTGLEITGLQEQRKRGYHGSWQFLDDVRFDLGPQKNRTAAICPSEWIGDLSTDRHSSEKRRTCRGYPGHGRKEDVGLDPPTGG